PTFDRAGPNVLPARTAKAAVGESLPAPVAVPPKSTRSGWMIQVGAYQGESEAKQQLNAVRSKAQRLLATADAFTESVLRGGTTYYRARFAGLDKEQAEAACRYLKQNDVDCLAI